MSKSKIKYPKIGDNVILLDPRPIERIGYEICVETIIPEVKEDPAVLAFIDSQRLLQSSAERIFRTIAVSRVNSRIRKGAERKIFYAEAREENKGVSFRVIDKKIRQLGFYYPSSYTGYEYDDYCEAAGLDKRKTIVCLNLNCRPSPIYDSIASEWNEGFWVTSDQVTWEGKQ